MEQAAEADQIQPATGIPGLSLADQNYLDAFFIPRDTTDIVQLLSGLEDKELDEDGERFFYEAITVAMRSDVSKQVEMEQLNADILASVSTVGNDSPEAFAKHTLEQDMLLDEGARKEQARVAEGEHAADASYIAGLKAAEFIAEIQDVPSDVADSKEEEELERLVLKGSYV